MTSYALPVTLTDDNDLSRYRRQIEHYPILRLEEEYMLAKAWREHEDIDAAQRLVTSHLRMSVKAALQHRGYGLPLSDLVQEGNRGLMQALKGFNPDLGNRFSTYAKAWINSAIKDYILKSWSLVKIGTTAAQKKLFFNLRRIKRDIQAIDSGDLKPGQVSEISDRLDVPERDVVSMNRRLAGRDGSLNAPVSGEGDGSEEWQDWLGSEGELQEEAFIRSEELARRRALLGHALSQLDERERQVFTERRLSEDPPTLQELGRKLGVSGERVRQIENRAFAKVQAAVRAAMEDEWQAPIAAKALPPAESGANA